jgi:thiamine pyrophosphate-dependent acetolactate synthase large subunit-like protein
MTSSEAFVETLVAHDTRHIFGIVGSAFMDALDIFEPAGIRFVSVQHEQNAVFVFQLLIQRIAVCLLLFFLIH